MDVHTIAEALTRPKTAIKIVNVLKKYNDPLSEKELKLLQEFNQKQSELIAAGMKLDETPEELLALAERPAKALHPLVVLRCIFAAAKVPVLPHRVQRRLQRVVLPLVALETPLSLPEWYLVLHLALSQFAAQIHGNRTVLALLLQLLVYSASEVFQNRSADLHCRLFKPQDRKTDASAPQPKLKEVSTEEAQLLWWKLFTVVARSYAQLHATKAKHSLENPLHRQGNEVFLQSAAVRQLRAVVARVCDTLPNEESIAAAKAVVSTKLDALEQFTVAVIAPPQWAAPLTKDAVVQLIKSNPADITVLLGGLSNAVPNTLARMEKVEEFLQTALYNTNLTNTTKEMYITYVTTLISLQYGELLKYVANKGMDALVQLFTPFLNNQKTLTMAVAAEVRPGLIIHLLIQSLLLRPCEAGKKRNKANGESDDAEDDEKVEKANDAARQQMWTFLAGAIPLLLNSKCRSPPEKAVVLYLLSELFTQLKQCTTYDPLSLQTVSSSKEVLNALVRELSVPAVESSSQAFRLCSALELIEEASAGIEGAAKVAKKDDVARKALLVYLSPDPSSSAVLTEVVSPLLEKCEVVEVSRPDAFLSLYFVIAHDRRSTSAVVSAENFSKWGALLSKADVLGRLDITKEDSELERARVAQVAIALFESGYPSAFTLLLTHTSGALQLALTSYLQEKKASGSLKVEQIHNLWTSVRSDIFGLSSDVCPALLSRSATVVATTILPLVIKHYQEGASSSSKGTDHSDLLEVLADMLLCCGHDYIQFNQGNGAETDDAASNVGARDVFYMLNSCTLRRHNKHLHVLQMDVFERVFGEGRDVLLSTYVDGILRVLSEAITKAPHVAKAAVRAFVLLLTKTNLSASQSVFAALKQLITASVEHFVTYDERDRAIAADSVEELLSYEESYLKAQNLIKNYPDRPPKGVTEDEYEDTKRKDGVALAKAREQLKEELAKRANAIRDDVYRYKNSFVALRLMGTNGHFNLVGVQELYPFLQDTLNKSFDGDLPLVVKQMTLDVIEGLLYSTPLRHLGRVMATVVGRLHSAKTLSVRDVAQVSTLAQSLRVAASRMMHASLFVVLTPFARIAFKAGRGGNAVATTIPVSAQHQLMGVLLQNLGQQGLPEPTKTFELLGNILTSFPPLFKSVQQGFHVLMSMIPAARLPSIEAGMFSPVDSVREVTAAALHHFSHFRTCRRALVLVYIFTKDSASANIPGLMEAIMNSKDAMAAEEKSEGDAAEVTEEQLVKFELLPTDWSDVLYFLKQYGQSRTNAMLIVKTMKVLFSREDTTEEQQQAWAKDIQTVVGGLGSVIASQELSSAYRPNVPIMVMNYLCDMLENLETPEFLMKAILSAGRTVLQQAELETVRVIAPKLQERVVKPPKDASATQKEQYLATSTVWTTIMSCRLQETELLEAIVEQQSRILNNSQSAMVHKCVCEAMIEITKNKTIRESPKLDEFMEKCIKQVLHSGSYIKKKAHVAGVAGVLTGLGLLSLRRYDIINIITTAAKQKQVEKSGAMVFIEALCETMGALFEPYALSLSNILLEGVADPDTKIAECADDASRIFMKNLTSVGLRQLVPKLVDALKEENLAAKKKIPPLSFVGYVAFCSPQQLAATLPQIMKHIIACLFDVNTSVSSAAFHALRRVAGVVSNPEIQEHVDLILNAMRSPSTEIEPALDALLYTRFINVVDAASLALIIPVLSRGLSGQTAHRTRPKAAQIIASMVSLVHDPNILSPYAKELIELLEESSQDPQSESRTTAAKAIGALAAALRGSLVDEIITWSFGVLEKVNIGTIEKAGAAQVYVELIHSCGDELFEAHFAQVEAGMTSEKPPVREGFLYIMVYAPSTLSTESFQKLLPIAFPWVLESLSHFSDKVRDVSLVAGDAIISLYGTRHLSLVLEPLLNSVTSEVTTMRQSSLLLTSKLVLHLISHIKKKMRVQHALEEADAQAKEELEAAIEATEGAESKELGSHGEEDGSANNGMLLMESAREVEKRGYSLMGSLEDMLGTQNLCRVLSAIYCGRNEPNANVRTDANMAWQAAVASIRAAVAKIFDSLVMLLVHFASSENPDCVEVAEKTIEFTSRMQETIPNFIRILCDICKEGNDRSKLGAFNCMSSAISLSTGDRLNEVGAEIVACVLPGIEDKNEKIQEAASQVFAIVSKAHGSTLVEDTIAKQLQSGANNGMVEVVKVKPTVALAIIFKFLKNTPTHTNAHVDLLDSILDIEEVEAELAKYMKDLAQLVLDFFGEDLEGVKELAQKLFAAVPEHYYGLLTEMFEKALRVKTTRLNGLLFAFSYGATIDVDNVETITHVFRAIIDCLGDDDSNIALTAVRLLSELIDTLEKNVIANEMAADGGDQAQDVTGNKRVSGRYLLQYLDTFHDTFSVVARGALDNETGKFAVLGEGKPRLFEVLIGLYNRGLDYGNSIQKVTSVECIQELLALSSDELRTTAAGTVAGRCSKVLFNRNDGSVVLVLMQLCQQLLGYASGPKGKMTESSIAMATFNAILSDNCEARALTLQVVINLLQRSDKHAELILGSVVTKKSAAETPLYKTVLCRFVSVLMRYGNFNRTHPTIMKMVDIVQPLWERPQSPAIAAASGVAMGALCCSPSVSEDLLSDLKERALVSASTKGVGALSAFSFTYSLLTAAPTRVDDTYLQVSLEHLQSAVKFASPDKLMSLWMIREAAALANTRKFTVAQFSPEVFEPLVRRTNAQDSQSLSTVQYFYDTMKAVFPEVAGKFAEYPMAASRMWEFAGGFDADLDDELEADVSL